MKKSLVVMLIAVLCLPFLGATDFSVGLDGYTWIAGSKKTNLDDSSDVTCTGPTASVLPGLHVKLFLGEEVGFFSELGANFVSDFSSALPVLNLSSGVAFQLVDDGTSRFEVGVGPSLLFLWFGGALGVYTYPEWTYRLTDTLALDMKLGLAWYPVWGFMEAGIVKVTDQIDGYAYENYMFSVTPYMGLKFM